jgi:glutathione S-transferase
MSLADVVAAVSLPLFDFNNELTKETHPHLFALYENLSTHKAFQANNTRFPEITR